MGRGRESEGSTAETVRKRPERPWTATRTMEVLRRCPFAIAQRLVHCAVAVSTAVLDKVTKTMSVALLLTNSSDNSKQKTCNLLSPGGGGGGGGGGGALSQAVGRIGRSMTQSILCNYFKVCTKFMLD